MIIFAILYVLFGWLVAIAINYAADILPTRQPLLQPHACNKCGTRFQIIQWSALLAWISNQRSCAQCGHVRATFNRSVVVELGVAAIFILLIWRYGFSIQLALNSFYTAVLVLITVTDLEHRLIFNIVTIPSILLAAAFAFVTPGLSWRQALLGGGVALAVTFIIWLLGVLFYGQGAFGVGDITLSTFLGLILGFPQILLSLIFGVFLGGIVAFLLIITRLRHRNSYIPYGPFLTITGWVMLIWGNEIWNYFY